MSYVIRYIYHICHLQMYKKVPSTDIRSASKKVNTLHNKLLKAINKRFFDFNAHSKFKNNVAWKLRRLSS